MGIPPPPDALPMDARPLAALHAQARTRPDQALREAARQFESLFMNMLMKSMRDAMPKDDPLASESGRLYTGMLDQHITQKLAARGVGLADMLVRQLSQSRAVPATPHWVGTIRPAEPAPALPAATAPAVPAAANPATADPLPEPTPAQRAFMRRMLPHAQRAQREFGVPAHFAIGQAGLESGWGRYEILTADGKPSRNLFGIKAGGNWEGATVDALTTEYRNGRPHKVIERFRAYPSYTEAFRDYAKLLSSTPRYAEAMQTGGDAASFARSVHAGGYATDPDYAAKLTRAINQTIGANRPVKSAT